MPCAPHSCALLRTPMCTRVRYPHVHTCALPPARADARIMARTHTLRAVYRMQTPSTAHPTAHPSLPRPHTHTADVNMADEQRSQAVRGAFAHRRLGAPRWPRLAAALACNLVRSFPGSSRRLWRRHRPQRGSQGGVKGGNRITACCAQASGRGLAKCHVPPWPWA